MNFFNIFAMLFAFIIGITFIWLLWPQLLGFAQTIAGEHAEVAIMLVVAIFIMTIIFIVVNPIGVGHADEK